MGSSVIISTFRQLSASDRVEVLCALLRCCMPLEIHYLSNLLEARRNELSSVSLTQALSKANNFSELAAFRDALQRGVSFSNEEWNKLAVFLALLRSDNYTSGTELFDILNSASGSLFSDLTNAPKNRSCSVATNTPYEAEVLNEATEKHVADESVADSAERDFSSKPDSDTQLLTYSLAAHHPALKFSQSRVLANVVRKLRVYTTANLQRITDVSPRTISNNVGVYESNWQHQQQQQQQQQQQRILPSSFNSDSDSGCADATNSRNQLNNPPVDESWRSSCVRFDSCRFTNGTQAFECRFSLVDRDNRLLRSVTRTRNSLLDFLQRTITRVSQSQNQVALDTAIGESRLRTQKRQIMKIDKIEQLVEFSSAFCQFISSLLARLPDVDRRDLLADVFFADDCSTAVSHTISNGGLTETRARVADTNDADEPEVDRDDNLRSQMELQASRTNVDNLNLPLSSTVTQITSASSRPHRFVEAVFSASSRFCRVTHELSDSAEVAAIDVPLSSMNEALLCDPGRGAIDTESGSDREREREQDTTARAISLRLPDLLECNQPARVPNEDAQHRLELNSRSSVCSSSSTGAPASVSASVDGDSTKHSPVHESNDSAKTRAANGLLRSISYDSECRANGISTDAHVNNASGLAPYARSESVVVSGSPQTGVGNTASILNFVAQQQHQHQQPPHQQHHNAVNKSFRRFAHASGGSQREGLLGRCFLCALPGHYAANCPYANAALAFTGLAPASAAASIPFNVNALQLNTAFNLGCVGLLNVLPAPAPGHNPADLNFASQPSALAAAMCANAMRPVGLGLGMGLNMGVGVGGAHYVNGGRGNWRGSAQTQAALLTQQGAYEQMLSAPQKSAKPMLANANGILQNPAQLSQTFGPVSAPATGPGQPPIQASASASAMVPPGAAAEQ